MSLRDLRKTARGHLHSAMSVPAVYVAPGGATTPCSIRVHDTVRDFGDMPGFDYAPAERRVEVPSVVALADEITPTRGGVFSVAPDEAYTVETVDPRHGITITAQVTRLSESEITAAGLPLPGDV